MEDTVGVLGALAGLRARLRPTRDPSQRAPHWSTRVLDLGLDDALATLPARPADDAANALVDPADRMTCEHDLIAASGDVRRVRVRLAQPRAALVALPATTRGCATSSATGWRDLRNPSPEFDLWWYWHDLPRPGARGRQPARPLPRRGPAPRPRHRAARAAACARCRPRPPAGRAGSACSRATTATGSSTTTSSTYVRELSRFADVYYLADCHLEAGELDKLAPYTQRPLDDPARPLRLRLLLDAGARPGRLGHDRDVRRAAPGQRQLLPAASRWTRCSPPWTPGRRTGGACRPPTTTSRRARPQAAGPPAPGRRPGGRGAGEDRPWRDLRLLPRRLLLPGAPVGGDRRPGVPASARHGGRPVGQELDHPQVRDRHLLLPDPGRATTSRRSSTACCRSTRSTASHGVRAHGGGLPLHQAAVPAREPLPRPRPATQWKRAGPRRQPRRRRRRDGARTSGGSPLSTTCAAPSTSTRLPNGAVADARAGAARTNFEEHERWVPRFDALVGLRRGPRDPPPRGQRPRGLRGRPPRPDDQEAPDRASGTPRSSAASTWPSPRWAPRSPPGTCIRAGTIFVSQGPRADIAAPAVRRAPTSSSASAAARRCSSYGATVPDGADGDRTRHNEALHDLDLTRFVVASSPAQARAMAVGRPLAPSAPKVWVTGSPRTDLLLRRRGVAGRRPARASSITLRARRRRPAAGGLGARERGERTAAPDARRRRPALAAVVGRPERRRRRCAPAAGTPGPGH